MVGSKNFTLYYAEFEQRQNLKLTEKEKSTQTRKLKDF